MKGVNDMSNWLEEMLAKAERREAFGNSRQIDLDEIKTAEQTEAVEKSSHNAQEPRIQPLSADERISPEALESVSQPLSGAQGKPIKQALVLDLHSGTLNYSEFARDVFNYIQRNKIDSVDTEYWRTHPDTNEPPEAEREYLKRIRVEQMKLYSKYGRNYAEETDLLKFEELETIDTMVACAWALLENHYTMQRDRAKADPASVTASGQ